MKKFTFTLIAILTLLAFPLTASAETSDNAEKDVTVELTLEQAQGMIDRLYEIKDMNLGNLSGPEKENLRNEVMSIKDQLQQNDGIYISAGALVIIILLILIL
jgi:ABC-type phosphate/phosphonate transport system substrate-binding protein